MKSKYSEQDIQQCLAVLEELIQNTEYFASLSEPQRVALLTAAGKLSRPHRNELIKRNKQIQRLHKERVSEWERTLRAQTGIRAAREAAVFEAPIKRVIEDDSTFEEAPEKNVSARNCYVCKAEFTQLHFFYDSMCPKCAAFNYEKRFQTAPLHGQVALITGSRLKIGYQATLMMLRAGATVIATTRFPIDSAARYAKEKDFSQWKDRLHIYGLDLRHTPSVELFCRYFEQKYSRLDLLINNAAQTVRRPPGFYAHLIPAETKPFQEQSADVQYLLRDFYDCRNNLLTFSDRQISAQEIAADPFAPVSWNGKSPGVGMFASARLSQIPYTYDQSLQVEQVFPEGKLDADLQQVDLRATNSWRLKLGEVDTSELLEIQLVNAVAPFVLCNRLIPMMKKENTGIKHIVNVTAMEGKFHRFRKADRHPHTNMAKAALNMMTHTAASDLVKYGIYMNAVDTGWVTDEDPAALAALKRQKHDFQPPLDIVDGAARVCDPFFDGILTGKHWCGKFLKDYFPIDW